MKKKPTKKTNEVHFIWFPSFDTPCGKTSDDNGLVTSTESKQVTCKKCLLNLKLASQLSVDIKQTIAELVARRDGKNEIKKLHKETCRERDALQKLVDAATLIMKKFVFGCPQHEGLKVRPNVTCMVVKRLVPG